MPEDPSLEALLAGARGDFDLTRADDQRSVSLLAEALEGFSEDEIRSALNTLGADAPLEAGIAALLARSRQWLNKHSPEIEIGIVFAM